MIHPVSLLLLIGECKNNLDLIKLTWCSANLYACLQFYSVIESIKFKKIELPMKKPFKISLGSTNSYEGFIVSVTADDGIVGYGEATTTPFITGDTIGSLESELRIFSESLKGMDESQENLNITMKNLCRSAKASRMAIDQAIWDIIGKRAKTSVRKLLGNSKDHIDTSYTVDLVDSKKAKAQAEELMSDGVKIFKIKMGLGIQDDLERVKVVRDVVGEKPMIYVDFNQSYTPRKSVEISKKLEKFEIEFMEQPVPMQDIRGLKFVRDRSNIPIFADESIFTTDDVLNVLQTESVDGINIKLMKSGGITDSVKMADLAYSYRVPVMIGCMVETRLANSAGLAVALSKPSVKYADLDGYSSLKEDIVEKGIEFRKGTLYPHDCPGVGVELKKTFVDREFSQKK